MYSLNLELKSTIVYEIEHVFGRRVVSSRDCIELSDEIYQKTKCQLNPNTLRRFFNLVKAEYPPSQATLTILSKYCGFQSIDDIYKIKNTETFETGCLDHDSVLHFFASLFRDTVVPKHDDSTFLTMVIHCIKFMNANKFLTDRFQSMISKTTHGKNYYFEKLINIDKLNSFYGDGLRYYEKEAGSLAATIYSASLYVYKYWLSGDDEKLLLSAEKLWIGTEGIILGSQQQARRLAAIQYHNNVTGQKDDKNRIDIHNAFIELKAQIERNSELYMFLYIIGESLMLTGYPEDALYYLEYARKIDDKRFLNHPSFSYSHLCLLIESYSLYNQKLYKKAALVFEKIKSSEFPFLSRKFSGILYLSLFKKMKPKEKANKYEDQFIAMISETGFKRLLSF